jgi:hypothetical protein
VFTRKPGLLRRRNRAVTLIEAVLYISVALALIVGGLVFFQQASTAAKTSTTVRQLSAIIAESKAVMVGYPANADPIDVTAYLISAGAVPQGMVASPASLVNPFGGNTTLILSYNTQYGRLLQIILSDVPQGVCARLLTASSGSDEAFPGATTKVASGLSFSAVFAPPNFAMVPRVFAMNATQAGWMCKHGSLNYTDKTAQPTSPPLSGNVFVSMWFALDY